MRIYAEPDDQTLKEINQKAKETGVGKSQLVLEAIDQFLHGSDQRELADTKDTLDKARDDLDKRWSEITTLRAEITALKAELSQVRSAYEKVMITNDQLKQSADQASSELEGLRRDQDHFKDTLRLKDDEISFLRGHVSQLSEKIPQLPPGQEEAKRKHWYQFWK